MKLLLKNLFLIVIVSFLSACQSMMPAQPDEPRYAPVVSSSLVTPPIQNGSIYQAGYSRGLFEDQRASRIGDIVTIILDERTASKKSTETSLTKDNETSVGGMTLHGLLIEEAMSGERDFSGSADADQSNSLKGNITVTVADVLPNGLLFVRGEKWITLTNGDELIRVSGLVRPADISPNNTVVSTKLADSRITYIGRGELADSTRMGWLARLFVSPFFFF
ncbi:MAG: flagellar basal body L-ring protein FlgH [Pseudomonadales bacterium]|nr:flagellar basal body L-ring protein FlgH [Pseudomonadales bacterium]